jgi:tRNA-binding protein
MSNSIEWTDFIKVEMRVGTIISAEVFTEAKKPAYKIVADFGNMHPKVICSDNPALYTGRTDRKTNYCRIKFPAQTNSQHAK